MADQLKRLADLSERLKGLDEKRRGNPIEADDWNAIVSVIKGILEIDRVQEDAATGRLEERFAAKNHEHLCEVGRDWLDADLQKNLASGAGSSVPLHIAFAGVRDRVDGVALDTVRVATQLEEQQKNIDKFAVADVDRGSQVRRMEDRLK